MSTKITPTVGRVVWFYPTKDEQTVDLSPPADGEPLAAIVVAVKSPDYVNLTVFDAMGFPHARLNVLLVQDGQEAPDGGFYSTWTPYQVEQAKKAEDRANEAKQLITAAGREADARRQRAGILEIALRTPGLSCHDDVLGAAKVYQGYIDGPGA
jgi:hypothetical protein